MRGPDGRFLGHDHAVAVLPGSELKRARGTHCGGRPQIRRKHRRALTARQIEKFLCTLAATCNVSASAKAARRTARVFYELRRRDAAFRGAWMEALREGYDHLELALVERARFGVDTDIFYQGVKTASTRVFTDGTAMRLLHLHRSSVTTQRERLMDEGAQDTQSLFDELAAKLEAMQAADADGSGCDG
jgi:hypothetical protein